MELTNNILLSRALFQTPPLTPDTPTRPYHLLRRSHPYHTPARTRKQATLVTHTGPIQTTHPRHHFLTPAVIYPHITDTLVSVRDASGPRHCIFFTKQHAYRLPIQSVHKHLVHTSLLAHCNYDGYVIHGNIHDAGNRICRRQSAPQPSASTHVTYNKMQTHKLYPSANRQTSPATGPTQRQPSTGTTNNPALFPPR